MILKKIKQVKHFLIPSIDIFFNNPKVLDVL